MRTKLRIVCYVLDTRTQRWMMSNTRVLPLPLASRIAPGALPVPGHTAAASIRRRGCLSSPSKWHA